MTRRTLVALFMASALFLAACGDDSGSVNQDAVDEAISDATDSDGSGGGDGSDVDLDGLFTGDCSEAVTAFGEAFASFGAVLDPNSTGTPDDTAALLEGVADAAPDEIADDFAVLAGVFAEYAQALADSGVDFSDPSTLQDPDALAALGTLGESLDEEALDEAGNNIEAWFDSNCEG